MSERWGHLQGEKLTSQHLEAGYLEWLSGGRRVHRRGQGTEVTAEPLSPRAVEVIHKTIKAAFALAADRGLLARNPAQLAAVPRVSEQRRTWWTPDQVGRFLAYCRENSHLPGALVETLVDIGGRRGEVLALRWADVDLGTATASITRQLVTNPRSGDLELRVTKRPRSKASVALHPETVTALATRRASQAADRLVMGVGWPGPSSVHHDLVFTWPDGRAISPAVLTRTIARLSVAAGLPRITPHGLRHSFASAALAARVPVEVVAARLGNTTRVVQEVYSHVIPADDAEAARIVGDLYRKQA